jgi:hypothetical protein
VKLSRSGEAAAESPRVVTVSHRGYEGAQGFLCLGGRIACRDVKPSSQVVRRPACADRAVPMIATRWPVPWEYMSDRSSIREPEADVAVDDGARGGRQLLWRLGIEHGERGPSPPDRSNNSFTSSRVSCSAAAVVSTREEQA